METTIETTTGDPTPMLSRQQRRHAKQEAEYRTALHKQGCRYVKGFSVNPKGNRHVGAKQLAKIERKNADVLPLAGAAEKKSS